MTTNPGDDMPKPTQSRPRAATWKTLPMDRDGVVLVVPADHGTRDPDGVLYTPAPVCRVAVGYGRDTVAVIADARMIAAAPDLLAACEAAFAAFDRWLPATDENAEIAGQLAAAVVLAMEGRR